MTTVVLDDSHLEDVYLVVTYADRVERLGPGPRGFAEMVKGSMDKEPPKGYVSSMVEPVEEEGAE